jgi:hypothetical protein
MRSGNPFAAPVVAALLAAACAPAGGDALPRIEVGVGFDLENLCAGSQSPAIALAGLPAGAERLAVRLSNIGVLIQKPRDWTVAAPASAPPRIPAGALTGYEGPCPGDQQRVIYRVEVLALAADGRALGHGFREVRVLPVNTLARERRGRADQAWNEDLDPPESFFGTRELFLRERDMVPPSNRPRQNRDDLFAPDPSRRPAPAR